MAEGFFVAFGEGWGAVGIDGAEVVLEGIEQPGYEEPSLAPGERAPLLTEKITHCDVSLTEGYGVTVTGDRYRCHRYRCHPGCGYFSL